jgi:dTDP-4-dehydrorhamnose reductase
MSKVWLITGSSRGFGRSLAEAVLAHGDLLMATARTPEHLSDLVARYGDQIRTHALDVTDPEQARAAVASTVEAFGRLDVVVNNAGYATVGSIEETPEEDWQACRTPGPAQAALRPYRPDILNRRAVWHGRVGTLSDRQMGGRRLFRSALT